MVKLTLTDLLSKQEIIDLWNDVYSVIIDDGEGVVFQLINNAHLEIDTYGFLDDGEWTPITDDFLVLKWDKQIFEGKDIIRISIIPTPEYKERKERADLIYEYETKIATAKRNNDTEAQYYYQDKLDELLREDDLTGSLTNRKEE